MERLRPPDSGMLVNCSDESPVMVDGCVFLDGSGDSMFSLIACHSQLLSFIVGVADGDLA